MMQEIVNVIETPVKTEYNQYKDKYSSTTYNVPIIVGFFSFSYGFTGLADWTLFNKVVRT